MDFMGKQTFERDLHFIIPDSSAITPKQTHTELVWGTAFPQFMADLGGHPAQHPYKRLLPRSAYKVSFVSRFFYPAARQLPGKEVAEAAL
jgi:hypothetical protein